MRAVGICLGRTGATLAVVEPTRSGWRLKTVAEVNWPGADPAARGAAQLLGRARRGLGLPRLHAVAVTAAPGTGGDIEGRTAGMLLARAGLVRGWTIDPPTAARAASGENTVAATEAGRLAAGAAIAAATPMNPPPRIPEPQPEPEPEPQPQPEPEPQPDLSLPEIGWAAQRIADDFPDRLSGSMFTSLIH
jgi:hypothetical protein